jgi:peptidoglycan/LPS O-acetylase OafA/YrhL
MLPSPPPPGIAPIFPLNGPAWSLFYEMVANVFYVAFFRYLSVRRLILLVSLGAFAICISALIFGEVGGGALVGRADLYTGGVARVGFSFFAGVLMCRLYRAGHLPSVKFSSASLILLTLACALIFDPRGARPLYDLLLVVIGFPILLAGAVHTEPRRWTVAFTALGIVSYPIYATHEFVLKVAHRALELLSQAGTPIPPLVSGLIIGSILFVIGWILDRSFDQPSRRWLAARFIRKQHPV